MRKIDFTFYQIYLWTLLIATFIYSYPYEFSFTGKNVIDVSLRYLAFIPFFGFAYKVKMLNRTFWQVFATIYLSWEMGCYFLLYESSIAWDILVLIVLVPKYFSVVFYPLYTMEQDVEHKERIRGNLEWLKTKTMLAIETLHFLGAFLVCIFLIRASIYSLFHEEILLGVMMLFVVIVSIVIVSLYRILGFGFVATLQLLTIVAFALVFNSMFHSEKQFTYKEDMQAVELMVDYIAEQRSK